MLERMMDVLAAKLDMDPADVRKKNLIPKFDDGHDVVTTLTYDSGDYPGALDKVLAHADYAGLRAEAEGGPGQRHLHRPGPRHLRRDLRPRAVAGRRGHRVPGGPLGERHRPLPPERQGARVHRGLAARPGRGDDLRPDRGQRAGGRSAGRQGLPRRHRQHPDGLGHLRQPHDCRRRGGAGPDRAQDPRQGQGHRRPPARGRGRGHGIRGRQVLRQGSARPEQDHRRHRPDGQRGVEHARGGRGGARGLDVLRPAQLHVPVRRPSRGGRGRRRDRRRRPEALCRPRRLRPADQPRDRRGSGARRGRAGGRARRCGRRPSTTRAASS